MIMGGLPLKFDRAKRATRSYVHDRVERTENGAVSYAVAAGLYAAAGLFVITTLLVGATALFRWIELRYGLFQAFGALGGLLMLFAVICTCFAIRRLKRPAKSFPSLVSRLRVAISAPPSVDDVGPAAAFSNKRTSGDRRVTSLKPALMLAATLAGWALARRRNLSLTQKQRGKGLLEAEE